MKAKLLSLPNPATLSVALPPSAVRWLPVGLMVLSVLLWSLSLRQIDIRAMNDLGLVSVMPPLLFFALFLLTASYCLLLRREWLNVPLLLAHVVIIIFMMYGITAVIEETPRFATTWKLTGIPDYIMKTGTVNPRIDAFFNWPGFFILTAFVTRVAGLENPLSFAAWAHVFFNLIHIGPLTMIYSAATDDKRFVWLGVWFFYLTNWIGQDYLAPQSMNYFFYLATLGILYKWFRVQVPAFEPGQRPWSKSTLRTAWQSVVAGWRGTPAHQVPSEPYQRVGFMGIIILMYVVTIASHQLTPFATLIAVTGLVVVNRITPRSLPILMGVLVGTWISYMTVTYMTGHLQHVTGAVGNVGSNVSDNVGKRLVGSDEHVFVLRMRMIMTVVLWGLAGLGGLRRLYKGYWDLSMIVLAAVPFVLIGMQSYGGELMLRVYLFALPAMAWFAAALFFTSPAQRDSWKLTALVGLTSVVLIVGFQFTRHGNERADFFTRFEFEAIQHLYTIAEPNSRIVVINDIVPWRYQFYADHKYIIADHTLREQDVDGLVAEMLVKGHPQAYLVINRGQKASAELFYGQPPGTGDAFEEKIITSGKFKLIFANPDAKIFTLAPGVTLPEEELAPPGHK